MKPQELHLVLRTACEFYQKVGMGHTETMIEGVRQSQRLPFVIVPNPNLKSYVQNLVGHKARPVLLREMTERLAGASGPIAWEHTALQEVFRSARGYVLELEAEVQDKQELVSSLEQALDTERAEKVKALEELNALRQRVADQHAQLIAHGWTEEE